MTVPSAALGVTPASVLWGVPDALVHAISALGIFAFFLLLAELVARTFLSTTISYFFKPHFERLLGFFIFLRYWAFNIDVYFNIDARMRFKFELEKLDVPELRKRVSQIAGITVPFGGITNRFDFRVQDIYEFSVSLHPFEDEDTLEQGGTEVFIRSRHQFAVGYRQFDERLRVIHQAILDIKQAISDCADRTTPTMETASLRVTLTTEPEKDLAKSTLVSQPKLRPTDRIENLYVYGDIPAMAIHFKSISALLDKPLQYLPLSVVK